MNVSKFIRFRGDIVNLTKVADVCYNSEKQQTAICYDAGDKGLWAYYDGDCRNELWDLIKLAMQPKDAQPDPSTKKNRLADSSVSACTPSHVGFTLDGTPIYERDGVLITV